MCHTRSQLDVLVPQNWLGGAKVKTYFYEAKLSLEKKKNPQISIWKNKENKV